MDSTPFLIDIRKFRENRDEVRHELDLELGAVLFLAENFRAGSGKITNSRKKAQYRSILKIGWPIWYSHLGEKEYIFIDGLNTINKKILAKLKFSPDQLSQKIQPLDGPAFLESLKEEILAFSEKPEDLQVFAGLYGGDLIPAVKKFTKYIFPDHEFAVPIPSLVKKDAVVQITEFLTKYPALMDSLVSQTEAIIATLGTKRDQVFSALDGLIQSINADYDARQQKLQDEVDGENARLGQEESQELEKLRELRENEKQNVVSIIKERVTPFKETITLLNSNWDEDKGRISSTKTDVEMKESFTRALSRLKQNATELDSAISKLDADVNAQIARFGEIDSDFNRREKDLQEDYAGRVTNENEKIEALIRERKEKVGEQEYLKTQISALLEQIKNNLQQFMNRKDEKLRIVENFHSTVDVKKTESVYQFFLPFYYLEFNDEGPIVQALIPPTFLGEAPQKKVGEISYSQKALPLEAAGETFLQYGERFKAALEMNPEIADLLQESVKSEQLNIILSSTLKDQAYKGFDFLKGRNLGKEKDVDKAMKNIRDFL